MIVSYKKLWKLLIDKDLRQKDLAQLAGISTSTITKMKNNENVTTGVLLKICEALHCGVEDIIEFVGDSKSERGV